MLCTPLRWGPAYSGHIALRMDQYDRFISGEWRCFTLPKRINFRPSPYFWGEIYTYLRVCFFVCKQWNSLEGLFTVLTARFPILAATSGSERSWKHSSSQFSPPSQHQHPRHPQSTILITLTSTSSSRPYFHFTYVVFSWKSLGWSNRRPGRVAIQTSSNQFKPNLI